MLTLGFEFTAGRYHATSWDHHVNEATVEWPPSPWRILRALAAAAHRLNPPPEPKLLETLLLDRLSAPPQYQVPPYREGHTRHWMPTGVVSVKDSRTKVFDAFVAFAPGARELRVHWPDLELTRDEAALLDLLLEQLGYLGRAESWVAAARIEVDDFTPNAHPAIGRRDEGIVRVLPTVVDETSFRDWQTAALAALTGAARKQVPKSRWSALTIETSNLRKHGWTRPPGANPVEYIVPGPAPAARPPRRRDAPPTLARIDVVGTVRARIDDALLLGDHLRKALMALSDQVARERQPERAADRSLRLAHSVFHGREKGGGPRSDEHQHAHFMAVDTDGDGFVEQLLVWAPQGLTGTARAALERLSSLTTTSGSELIVGLVGLERDAPPDDQRLGESRVWASRTPFLLNRHPKGPGPDAKESPENQLRRELRQRGLPEPVAIERIARLPLQVGRDLHWLKFKRVRRRQRPAIPQPFGFRLTFDEPVRGPLALGFGAHFGLGCFGCEADR